MRTRVYDIPVREDFTRSQADDAIEDYVKSREFEKRVHNIVVDAMGDFIDNMWAKKSMWKDMIRKR